MLLVPAAAAALKHFSDVVQTLLIAGASCRLALAAPEVRSAQAADMAQELPGLLPTATRDEIVQWFNERQQGGQGALFLTGDVRRMQQVQQQVQGYAPHPGGGFMPQGGQPPQSHGMPLGSVAGGYGYYHPPQGSHAHWQYRQPVQQAFHVAHAGHPQRAMPPPGPGYGAPAPRGAAFIPVSAAAPTGSFPPVQAMPPTVPAVSAPAPAPAPAPAQAASGAPAKARSGYAAAAAKPAAAPAPKPSREQQLDGLMQAAAASEAAAAQEAAAKSAAAAAAYAQAEAKRAAAAAAGGKEGSAAVLGKKRNKPRTTQDASGGLWDGEADLGAEASTRTSGSSSWAARAAK